MKQAIDIIKDCEGCKLQAYQDSVGIWTIGYGTTGPDVVEGLEWTQEQADARLEERVQDLWHAIQKLLKVPQSDNQMAALISFTYNIGIGALSKSTLLAKINIGDGTAPDEFLRWDKAGGHVIAGLANRRAKERALYVS